MATKSGRIAKVEYNGNTVAGQGTWTLGGFTREDRHRFPRDTEKQDPEHAHTQEAGAESHPAEPLDLFGELGDGRGGYRPVVLHDGKPIRVFIETAESG